ncbi:MAG: TetR/AcrR family transcriptional regulator [Phenylobacterium sp.]|uniref:TetR/AcrR family transcriptional regulator n=1 Tax=Phenylobacterium sp. TaxID=1871053 RepID=UPI0025F2E14F|nr:TetR/AcrR family transcriptional regulator [Phenylobacterium sp.]MBA4013481.1 TetR/AcrR family transcriptional regulator [Phenylobacterium sp.]
MTWTEQGARRRPYHVGNLRILLLDEARALLETGGRSELNLRALAGRAGIAAGSVYHHYASKAALLAGLAAMGFREMEASLREAAAHAETTPIRTTALAYFDFARAQPALYELMFDATLMGEADVAEARDSAFAVLQEVIAGAPSQQGVDPTVIHKVALAVWACGHGAASLTQADESGDSPLMEDVIQGLEALFRPR